MRAVIFAMAITGVLLSPAAFAAIPHPQALVVDRVDDSTVLVAWTPIAGSTNYVVYKGASFDDLHQVERTTVPYYFDAQSPPGTVYEVVTTSLLGDSSVVASGSEGDCVSVGSNYELEVTTANCLKGM